MYSTTHDSSSTDDIFSIEAEGRWGPGGAAAMVWLAWAITNQDAWQILDAPN
jgi:hypothetical protein